MYCGIIVTCGPIKQKLPYGHISAANRRSSAAHLKHPILVLMGFAFATLCVHFARSALPLLVLKLGREETAKKCKEMPVPSSKMNSYLTNYCLLDTRGQSHATF